MRGLIRPWLAACASLTVLVVACDRDAQGGAVNDTTARDLTLVPAETTAQLRDVPAPPAPPAQPRTQPPARR
ncbi:MAG: hypothetical protein ACREMN_07775, partial [Gemmatimonadales bacterium]